MENETPTTEGKSKISSIKSAKKRAEVTKSEKRR